MKVATSQCDVMAFQRLFPVVAAWFYRKAVKCLDNCCEASVILSQPYVTYGYWAAGQAPSQK